MSWEGGEPIRTGGHTEACASGGFGPIQGPRPVSGGLRPWEALGGLGPQELRRPWKALGGIRRSLEASRGLGPLEASGGLGPWEASEGLGPWEQAGVNWSLGRTRALEASWSEVRATW